MRVNRGGADRLAIGRRRDREPITWIVEDRVVRAIRTEEDGGRWSGRIGREQFSTRRVRVRARHPRRGEAGGPCRRSRLGGGSWVRPLGYICPLYSGDEACESNWRAVCGTVRLSANSSRVYCSSSSSRRVKFVACVSEFVQRLVR